jgi:hypothetical protein
MQSLTVFTQALPPHAAEALYGKMTPSFKKSRIRKLTRSHHTFPFTSLVIPAFRKHKAAFCSQHTRVLCPRVSRVFHCTDNDTHKPLRLVRLIQRTAHSERECISAARRFLRGGCKSKSYDSEDSPLPRHPHSVTMCVWAFREQMYKMQ